MPTPPPSHEYRHRQAAGAWLKLLMGGLVLGLAALTLVDPAGAVAVAVGLALAFTFRSLTVTVTADEVRVHFGSGWPRRTIPLGEVRACRVVRNRWWYGFGIRLTPHGWLWNLDGLDAVELDLPGDRRFRIGTDEPGALQQALQRSIDRSPDASSP